MIHTLGCGGGARPAHPACLPFVTGFPVLRTEVLVQRVNLGAQCDVEEFDPSNADCHTVTRLLIRLLSKAWSCAAMQHVLGNSSTN